MMMIFGLSVYGDVLVLELGRGFYEEALPTGIGIWNGTADGIFKPNYSPFDILHSDSEI